MSFLPHGTPASSSAVKWKNNPLQILYYSFNARKPRKTENHKKFNTCSALPWISPRHPSVANCNVQGFSAQILLLALSSLVLPGAVEGMGWDGGHPHRRWDSFPQAMQSSTCIARLHSPQSAAAAAAATSEWVLCSRWLEWCPCPWRFLDCVHYRGSKSGLKLGNI